MVTYFIVTVKLEEMKFIVDRNLEQLFKLLLLFLRLLKSFHSNFCKENKVLSLSREKFLWEEKEIDRSCHIQKCNAMPCHLLKKNHLII